MQACKIRLPQSDPDPSLVVSSILFEPISHSLALMRSDYSLLLFPSFSLFPNNPNPKTNPTSYPITNPNPNPTPNPSPSLPPTLITPPPQTSSFAFLRLHPSSSVVFLTASPYATGSSVLLRAWLSYGASAFAPVGLNLKNRTHPHRLPTSATVLELPHGFSVKIAGGSVNVFALHSPSAAKIWVLYAKLSEGGGTPTCVDLIKCAVIECTMPIHMISVSMGFLILGEMGGIRAFPLRPLVKGKVKKKINSERRSGKTASVVKKKIGPLQNGVAGMFGGSNYSCTVSVVSSVGNCCNHGSSELDGAVKVVSSDGSDARAEVDRNSAKCRIVKLRQDSGELGSMYVAFKCSESQSTKGLQTAIASPKPVSIHALSQQRFLILDSVGDLYLWNLHNTALGSEVSGHSCMPSRDGQMRRLDYTMKVQMLAVLPDISMRTHTVWTSDGCHSVHLTSLADIDVPTSESEKDEREEQLMQISATQAIFTSEKIQDVIPYSTNAVLILGQGCIFGYAIA